MVHLIMIHLWFTCSERTQQPLGSFSTTLEGVMHVVIIRTSLMITEVISIVEDVASTQSTDIKEPIQKHSHEH